MLTFIDVHKKDINEIEFIANGISSDEGVCLFVDITSSTEIKYMYGIKEWLLYMKNTFNILNLQPKIQTNIIKYIGDAIMVFIPIKNLFKMTQASMTIIPCSAKFTAI